MRQVFSSIKISGRFASVTAAAFVAITLSLPSGGDVSPFRYHLSGEPLVIHPALFQGSEASYFTSAIFGGLFKYDDKRGLLGEGANECHRPNKKTLICSLNSKMKWSDGTRVIAQHYLQAFRHLIDPKTAAPDAELLFTLRNARAIFDKKKKPQELGVEAPNDSKLVFHFAVEDYDFEYKLISQSLVPWKTQPDIAKPHAILANGPYRIKDWIKQKKIILEANPHYPFGNPSRPPIEILFVEDDSTALTLFDKGILHFLRRLPTANVPAYRNHPGFVQKPVTRFDYIGLGPQLDPYPELRKALALGLDFEEFKRAFFALGRPGCPGFPIEYMDRPRCYDFDRKAAQAALSKVTQNTRNLKLLFGFSRLGGEDTRRAAEWFQAQWKKHLGVEIELFSQENQMFLQELKLSPPTLFRKGVTLDRPTCLAALETFSSLNPENYVRYKSVKFNQVVKDLASTDSDSKRKKLCGQGMDILLKDYKIIPLGRIHFALLIDSQFKGWTLNELNLIDVANLQHDPKRL